MLRGWRRCGVLRAWRGACRHQPLDDQIAFKLGDGADDDHDRAAQRAACVDLFAEADELDVQAIQLIEDLEECFTDRAMRSEAQTRTMSNGRGVRPASSHRGQVFWH
jgi:hypothetical protein